MLFGLFGVSVIALGAYFLYRYLKWRSDANQFEQTGGVFNERGYLNVTDHSYIHFKSRMHTERERFMDNWLNAGALLPLHQEVSSPPTFFQAIQSSWPFNTRLFVHQPGRVIHAVNVDSHHHVPTDFCNPEDLRKDNCKCDYLRNIPHCVSTLTLFFNFIQTNRGRDCKESPLENDNPPDPDHFNA